MLKIYTIYDESFRLFLMFAKSQIFNQTFVLDLIKNEKKNKRSFFGTGNGWQKKRSKIFLHGSNTDTSPRRKANTFFAHTLIFCYIYMCSFDLDTFS